MKRKEISKIIFSVTGVLLVGKLLGFVKQMLIAAQFGATLDTDIINLSQNFINDIQYVLVQMLLTSFTAIYIHTRESGELNARRFSMDTIKAFSLVAAVIVGFVEIFAGKIAQIIAPTYTVGAHAQLAFNLRLFAPALVLFVWIAIFHALLNANERFVPGELANANQSIIMILLILLFSKILGVSVLAIAFLTYTLWNTCYLAVLSRKYWGRSSGNPYKNPAVRQLLHMALPLLLGYSMVYINQQVDKILVSGLQAGTVSAMGYASVLSNLVGTFIVSFCSILFTYVTSAIAEKKDEKAGVLSFRATMILILIFLPISILTFICAHDIVRIVFGRGAFSDENIEMAAFALQGYALMFVPMVLREVYSRVSYGYQDSRRPMINSTIGIFFNMTLSIMLCPHWGVFGVTLATSVSVLVCGVLNILSAKRHNLYLQGKLLIQQIPLMTIAGIACTAVAVWSNSLFQNMGSMIRFILVTICAGGIYFLLIIRRLLKLLRNRSV